MNYTVRARQKPLEQLPEWALCCAEIREIYAAQGIAGLEVEVIPEAFMAEVECRFCHRIIQNVKYMRIVRRKSKLPARFKHSAIPVDCFEFDEGLIL